MTYFVPVEVTPPADEYDYEVDNGTMPENVRELADAVVGHRIVSAERVPKEDYWSQGDDYGYGFSIRVRDIEEGK